ncbi:amidohydrolase family protein [Actinopolymorpha sp. B11F2]|uniref:amidohydrolase family protein n=1 Tax=Actinopolymorpha sp. B11F2 TaxID=3160862 RepID=UPI0032E5292D
MIDFHTHTPAWKSATWLAGAAFGAGEFVQFMDSAGIDAAVVLSHDGLFDPTPEANDDVAGFVAEYPDRMLAFGTASPRQRTAVAEVERCFTTLGMAGLKLHPWLQGFSMHERSLDPICEVVTAAGGVLLCHDGTPPYSTPLQIAALARRHPRLPVVLGHGGLHDCWREALAATVETPNLYLCVCGTPPYAARRILAQAPPGKVLFGTDAGLSDKPSQDYAVARVREIDGWGATPDQRRAMLVDAPHALLEKWIGPRKVAT